MRLDHRPENASQDRPHRVAHPCVEFAVLAGVLDKVLVKDNTTGFKNRDRGRTSKSEISLLVALGDSGTCFERLTDAANTGRTNFHDQNCSTRLRNQFRQHSLVGRKDLNVLAQRNRIDRKEMPVEQSRRRGDAIDGKVKPVIVRRAES